MADLVAVATVLEGLGVVRCGRFVLYGVHDADKLPNEDGDIPIRIDANQGCSVEEARRLEAAAAELGREAERKDLPGALAGAEQWAMENGGAVCVTGSLYLVGEVLERKGINPFG